MKPKERREIAIALYGQCRWAYRCISKAIGDNNKTNVQAMMTVGPRLTGYAGHLREELKKYRRFTAFSTAGTEYQRSGCGRIEGNSQVFAGDN
jgi:hypothetical protein